MAGSMSPPPAQSFRLFLDVRAAFPYPPSETRTKTAAWASTPAAARALSVLPVAERAKVLRYYRPCDAALSLGSHLLKHYAIARCVGVSWADAEITQERNIRNGKPFYEPGGVEFNVSHHGDVVVLIASSIPGANVGLDVVKADVNKDRPAVQEAGGWEEWVRVFSDAFTPVEMSKMVTSFREQGLDEEERLRQRLKFFYAHWALKEGYIKLTGDALMATWLTELDFNPVVIPEASEKEEGAPWSWGETTRSRAWLRGEAIEDATLEIQALGRDYMVATATSGIEEIPTFQQITVDEIFREISR